VVGVAKAQERLTELLGLCCAELAPFGAAGEALRAIAEQVATRALKTNGKLLIKEMQS
jgi:hypothetical protein